jgi:hypothetical protein
MRTSALCPRYKCYSNHMLGKSSRERTQYPGARWGIAAEKPAERSVIDSSRAVLPRGDRSEGQPEVRVATITKGQSEASQSTWSTMMASEQRYQSSKRMPSGRWSVDGNRARHLGMTALAVDIKRKQGSIKMNHSSCRSRSLRR